jgi:uncharacterized metal-binding protein
MTSTRKQKDLKIKCAVCREKVCRDGRDCFGIADDSRELYRDAASGLAHRAASAIEARHYCEATRLSETRLFARELGCRKLGLAFCIGLEEEACYINEFLAQEFEVVSVCCKTGGIAKSELKLEQICPEQYTEVMCNPAGQAALLNEAGTELNILCGLCVGHDAVFARLSSAPVTTLIAKDRVLAHNPVGAVYSRYLRRINSAYCEEEK